MKWTVMSWYTGLIRSWDRSLKNCARHSCLFLYEQTITPSRIATSQILPCIIRNNVHNARFGINFSTKFRYPTSVSQHSQVLAKCHHFICEKHVVESSQLRQNVSALHILWDTSFVAEKQPWCNVSRVCFLLEHLGLAHLSVDMASVSHDTHSSVNTVESRQYVIEKRKKKDTSQDDSKSLKNLAESTIVDICVMRSVAQTNEARDADMHWAGAAWAAQEVHCRRCGFGKLAFVPSQQLLRAGHFCRKFWHAHSAHALWAHGAHETQDARGRFPISQLFKDSDG